MRMAPVQDEWSAIRKLDSGSSLWYQLSRGLLGPVADWGVANGTGGIYRGLAMAGVSLLVSPDLALMLCQIRARAPAGLG